MAAKTDYLHLYIRGGNTRIPTCAVDHIKTEQSQCRPRITPFYRDIVIMKIVNWISTEIIRLSMVLFDRGGIRLNRSTAVEKIPFFLYIFFLFFFVVFLFFLREWGLIFYSFSSLN